MLVADLRETCIQDLAQETLYTQLEHTEAHAIGTWMLTNAASLAEPTSDSDTMMTEPAPMERVVNEATVPQEPTEPRVEELHAGKFSPEHLWTTLQTQWEIKEQPFHSDVPVIGKSVAAFRRAWLSILF